MADYAEKMQYRHPPIQEHVVYSHLISSNMYVHVYILCNIYSTYIYIYIYIPGRPFVLEKSITNWKVDVSTISMTFHKKLVAFQKSKRFC